MGLTYQMELILNITSYHRLSPEIEASKTTENVLTFGRSETCDWHFPDPEKIISSKHGRIEKEDDAFYVYDDSTNGVFVNFGVTPLGQGNRQRLSDKDVLTIGDFQIDVKLVEPQGAATSNAGLSQHRDDFMGNKPESFSQPHHFTNESLLDESMPAVDMVQESFSGGNNQIPEDWDELSSLMAPASLVADKPVFEEPQKPEIAPAPPKQNVAAKVHTPEPSSAKAAVSSGSALSDAFLKGLGVKAELQDALNTQEHWFEMGQGLNLLLNELMESLRQRAHVKNQLRLNHTMFQTKQNNPLKFSADVDDVIQNLFIRNSASFLSSKESIKESFVDTRRHEHALLAGADGVLKGMLAQVSPQHISQQVNDNANILKIIPGQIDYKCWKLYESLHDDLSQEVNTKGAMAMSDDFLKAYNDRIKETL